MASVFKREGGKYWTASWFDHEGKRRERSTGTTDKRLAERIAHKWEDEATARRTGVVDARAAGIAEQEARPLAEHVTDFLAYLAAKSTTDQTIDAAAARIQRIIEHAKVDRIADLTPSAVLGAIQHVRTPGAVTPAGISNKTATHYVRAIKAFTRWAVRDKRTSGDALAHLAGFNEATDRRRVRRDLTAEELARLIEAASKSPDVIVPRPVRDRETGQPAIVEVRMTCPDRAWAYRIAAGTGSRASEVSSLTPASFDLSADTPTVTVEACYSKRKRRDVHPIRRDLADLLAPWLAAKLPRVPVCPLPDKKAALLVRADLATARAAWLGEARTDALRAEREGSDFLLPVDAAGRVVDFHALRHTYISRVVESGASVKVAQELARHSTPTLTIGRYAHARIYDLASALADLPAAHRLGPTDERAKATGTDGGPSDPPHVGPQLTHGNERTGATSRNHPGRTASVGGASNSRETKGLRDGMRPNSVGYESAERRTRTADLRVMNPAL